MINPQESIIDFDKYLKKLRYTIEYCAVFSFIDLRILNKNVVDDIWCCLEASWPAAYKEYIAKHDKKKVKSHVYYEQLFKAVKNRFLFSSSYYKVDLNRAISAITSLSASIKQDINFICNDQSGMF